MRTPILLAALPAAMCLAPRADADTIYLTNGKTISGVDIQSELLDLVTYKEGRQRSDVPSDEVLAIEYARKPKLLDRAETALAAENYEAAARDLEEYITGVLSKPPRRHPWAPAYAMFRLVELYEALQEVDLMVKAADNLIANAGDSRYAPLAYLKKADGLFESGKASKAKATLNDFGVLVSQQGLGARWELERDLRGLLYDEGIRGQARVDKLKMLSTRAGVRHPVVRNRAEVALGETLFALARAAKTDKQRAQYYTAAEKVFADVAADPKADTRTLAAAFVGLGDCLYQRGAGMAPEDEKRAEILRQALFAYMRVVVVYKQELRYVPKAMFYAGRTFDIMGDEQGKERAQIVYSRVIRTFRRTKWADEARGFRKKK